MIDLHCHILPGIDDGAPTLEVSLAMARIAVADGITTLACTPHIYPGMYMNDRVGILAARDALQAELNERDIELTLSYGADVHLVPGLVEGIGAGRIPTLAGGRYLLLEPSHNTAPPRFADLVWNILASGYTPVITHPERLAWVGEHFEVFRDLVRQGVWMQVTACSLTGVFGPFAREWGERFVREGMTHILASDAHTDGRRRPVMSEARELAARWLGAEEADQLVQGRPQVILDNRPPNEAAALPDADASSAIESGGGLKRLWRRLRGASFGTHQ